MQSFGGYPLSAHDDHCGVGGGDRKWCEYREGGGWPEEDGREGVGAGGGRKKGVRTRSYVNPRATVNMSDSLL